MKRYQIPFFIAISLTIHFSALAILSSLNFKWSLPQVTSEETKPLNILDMRTVGVEEGKRDSIPLQKSVKTPQKNVIDKKLKVKDLSFNSIENEAIAEFKKTRPGKESLLKKRKKPNTNLSITNSKIKNFLTSDPYDSTPADQLARLDEADVQFDLVVPKGVPEDELNKHELVFYSFRKRTALAYVNSFQKQLNTFETQNPHLRFPLTRDPETIAGKITYDKNGDILRIETLKYTQITKLQDFFMEVLQDMSSLPNPPKEIVNDREQFVINFVLEVNSRL